MDICFADQVEGKEWAAGMKESEKVKLLAGDMGVERKVALTLLKTPIWERGNFDLYNLLLSLLYTFIAGLVEL